MWIATTEELLCRYLWSVLERNDENVNFSTLCGVCITVMSISTAKFEPKYFSRSYVVKWAVNSQTSGKISETVQDRDIVTMEL